MPRHNSGRSPEHHRLRWLGEPRFAPLRWLLLSVVGTALALAASAWSALPPPLTGDEPLAATRAERRDRVERLESVVRTRAAELADWEARADLASLLDTDATVRGCAAPTAVPGGELRARCAEAAARLAEWARRLDALWQALPPYRSALAELDAAEMARTRLLGGVAESLRPATWPIVEHLKLYPDAERDHGAALASDPPDLLAAWFDALADAYRAASADAAGSAGTGLSDLLPRAGSVREGVLRWTELDLRYGETLRDYDAAVEAASRAVPRRPDWQLALGRVVLALAMFAAVGGSLAVIGSVLAPIGGAPAVATLAALALSLGIYYLAPNLALAGVGGLAFLALAYRRLDLALVLVPATLPFHFHPRPLAGLHFALAEFATVACAAAYLLRLLPLPGGPRARVCWRGLARSPFLWPALLFLVAGTLSLVVARGEFLREAVRAYRLTIVEPVVYAGLVALCVAPRQAPLVAALFLAVAALVGAHAVGQYALGQGVSPMEGVERVASLYPSATALALFLGRAAPLAFGLLLGGSSSGSAGLPALGGAAGGAARGSSPTLSLRSPLKRASDEASQPAAAGFAPSAREFTPGRPGRDADRIDVDLLRRAGAALLLGPLLGGLLVTWTRGAWLGVWVGVLVMLLVAGRRRLALGWAALAVAGVGLLAASRVERLATLFSLSDGTNVSRLLIWQAALAALRDHPVFGIGLDQFLYLDRARYGVPDVRFLLLAHPHNAVLDLWLSLGLLGLVGGVWLVVALVRTASRLVRDARVTPGGLGSALALGLLGSTVDALVHGMVDLAYFVPDLAVWWWTSAALLDLLRRSPAARGREAEPAAGVPGPPAPARAPLSKR